MDHFETHFSPTDLGILETVAAWAGSGEIRFEYVR